MSHELALLLDPSACPSEDEVVAFAAGRLSPARRRAAHLHLDGCPQCQELLNEAVHALAVAPTDALLESAELAWGTQFRPGTLVGERYVIRQFIARGGMGEVYEAFDRELQERVALKTVTATTCDSPTAVRRLKAEVQLARRVSHPNVCRIYDFGTHAGPGASPTCFLTMQFVDGETLGERVRREGALPVDEACALARALLLGLEAAHDAGVLHRDFKSDNVMLRADSRQTSPLILDFGLARASERTSEQSSSQHHGVVGTFAYLAPEQLEGAPHSTASDIYSFGVVWFEMLTGQLPFRARSSPALATLDRLTRDVPPPSSYDSTIPEALDALVLGCLARAPGERFTRASDVLSRLTQLSSSLCARPKRRFLPRSLTSGLLGGLAVGLVAGYLGWVTSSSRARPIAHRASLAPLRVSLAALPEASPVLPPGPHVEALNDAPPPPVPTLGPRRVVSASRPQPRATHPEPARRQAPDQPVSARVPAETRENERGWENPFDP